MQQSKKHIKQLANSRIALNKRALGCLALLVLQLTLAVAVIDFFDLDPAGSLGRALYVLPGLFLVHALVPFHWKRPLVLVATVGVLFVSAGAVAGAFVLATGLLLIGVCHLPLSFKARVGIVCLIGILLAMLRSGFGISAPSEIRYGIAILGALFMFRLVVYLYDLRTEKQPVDWVTRMGYFFLLPNPVFPMFPVLDWKVYLNTYYRAPALEIYQAGLLWIARGISHLILYRIVYHYFTPQADEVIDYPGVITYCVSAYLLYLRVSGLFHLIAGTLYLFGYRLPETHRLYLLASGFSDYWRRINIYWKDFMTKIVFYPSYVRLKGVGTTAALALATGIVFVVTTALHSYQWFWLKGTFFIEEVDYWFWGLFGVMVAANNILEVKRGASKSLKKAEWNPRAALALCVKTLAMFIAMCLMWSMWTSHTISNWWGVIRNVGAVTPGQAVTSACVIALMIALGWVALWFQARTGKELLPAVLSPTRSAVVVCANFVFLLALWQYHLSRGLPGEYGRAFDLVRGGQLNQRDQTALERGYYEGLLVSHDRSYSGNFIVAEDDQPERMKPDIFSHRLYREVDDIRHKVFRENATGTTKGVDISMNRWGMRDRDYPLEKPENTLRIAVLGASYTMGLGVPDEATFENVAEQMLNAHFKGKPMVEVMNFGVSGYSTLESLYQLEHQVVPFAPDAVLMIAHGGERQRVARKMARRIHEGQPLSFPYLERLQRELVLMNGGSYSDAVRALKPRGMDILEWAYKEMARVCAEHGITPCWIFLPTMRMANAPNPRAMQPFAIEAGFDTAVLERPYGGIDPEELKITETNYHPNPRGHAFIAEALVKVLLGTDGTPGMIGMVLE